MEHTEGGGTTSVAGAPANVRPHASHGIRDAADRSPLRRSDAPRRTPGHHQVKDTVHHFDLVASILRLSVSAAVRWEIRRLAAPNRIHRYHFDRMVGITGRMGHSDTTADPHRETKYRRGLDPNWPVCHRFGPRFIITRHLRSSFGICIRLHILWGINHYFNHRTFSSANIPGS